MAEQMVEVNRPNAMGATLVVTATPFELKPLLGASDGLTPMYQQPFRLGMGTGCWGLATGVGAAPTAHHLSWALAKGEFKQVVNIGIAGSYSPYFVIGDVVVIGQDTFADYGVDCKGNFVSAFQHGLTHPNEPPYDDGWMFWPHSNRFPRASHLPVVKGATVATASGSEAIISAISRRLDPDIETMEAAAVFFTCLMAGVPFICLRAISNRVEPRDASKWDIPLAVKNLSEQALQLIG